MNPNDTLLQFISKYGWLMGRIWPEVDRFGDRIFLSTQIWVESCEHSHICICKSSPGELGIRYWENRWTEVGVVWGNTHFLNCSRRSPIVPGEGVYSQITPKAMEPSKKLGRVLSHCLMDPKTVENGSVGRQLTCAYPTIFMPNPRV